MLFEMLSVASKTPLKSKARPVLDEEDETKAPGMIYKVITADRVWKSADFQKLTGMSRGTINGALRRLVARGKVEIVGSLPVGNGRGKDEVLYRKVQK